MEIISRCKSFFSLLNIAVFAFMVLSYVAMIYLSGAFFMVGEIAILWLGNGIATALFLVCSPKRWPHLALGIMIAYFIGVHSHFGSFDRNQIAFLLANVLSVVLTIIVFKKLCKEPVTFNDLRQNILFLTVLCMLSALLNIVIGATALWVISDIKPVLSRSLIWFVGNTVSIFASTLTAFHIFSSFKNKTLSLHIQKQQVFELGILCLSTLLILVEVFGREHYNKFTVSLIFLLFPVAMWVALRFNHYITSVWITVVFLTCGFYSTVKLGPFIFMFNDLSYAIFYMQIYIFTACSTALIIGTINTEKESKNHTIAELNKQLDNLTKIDPLTKIANRRKYDDSIKQALASAKTNGTPLTLIAIDIDYFKLYNDEYGHLMGDECLVSVANAINKNLLRTNDIVARMGGEEFFCILPNTDSAAAIGIMQKIQSSIAELNIPHQASPIEPYLTVSMGACTKTQSDNLDAMRLYQLADTALYAAKEQGRNTYVMSNYSELSS
ncbi:diguanylate cyclase domain-containing protein [Paraglaciecola sp. 2405UD69-4]|uniref:sensor domain-containing diguanylate cyclase n=1 Tax=Paraglaciecola sp. 2405UD69-4 TaxID=3391836 RepID=UPI0039C982B7